ncbi:PP2C family serine/threonine-protein phosphatase [uncultured Methanoregula sp.]|uniref:PP2C family serine/threonine-protein phosphatase n=1 Tax=uncultured Methanoregula sp. TaxID=1005933 RepID=UPI002AAAC5C7|nr:PP2C family serine/threonine-protein phosphatase [uncultured Methanoregula sp.]
MQPTRDFQCTSDASLGWAFGCSRTGASHISSGRPCEDAFALFSGSSGAKPCIAVAVADGHGDPRHDLSRTGSALAVQAAIDELIVFQRLHLHDVPNLSIRAEFKADFPRRTSRRWREAVNEEPLRNENGYLPSGSSGNAEYSRYGSTLIAAMVVADMILISQIGDGDVVLVRPDGTIETPIPADPSLVGKETHSISSRDAHLLWRTATLDRGPGGVLIIATDGVSDSFDGSEGEEFIRFIRSLVARINEFGMESVAGSMKSWLDRYSALASGDDMTLVFVCVNEVEEERESAAPQTPGNHEAGSVEW